jgi:hypothetical protein
MNLISDLVRVVQDDEAQQLTVLLNRFNPFTVLRIGHYELRHTNTLAWLLDPAGNHGLGEAFLRAFVQRLDAQQGDTSLASRFETAADRAVTVRREVPLSKLRAAAPEAERLGMEDMQDTQEVPTAPVRRGRASGDGAIDILLEGDGWVLAIEAKVRSSEGREQLQNYRKALAEYTSGSVDRRKACFHIYLTVEGDEPSDNAWQIATWREHAIAPLEAVLAIRPDVQPAVLTFLESYLETLRRHAGDGDEAEIAAARIAQRFAPELLRVQAALRVDPTTQKLDPAAERVARRHAPLLSMLLDQLVSPHAARAKEVQKVMQVEGFQYLPGAPSYMKFVPKGWSNQFPVMLGGEGPMVAFEFANRTPTATVKLMVPGLGQDATDALAPARRNLIRLIQEDGNRIAFPMAFCVQREGEPLKPRPPTPNYFSVYSHSDKLKDEEASDGANAFVKSCLDDIRRDVEPVLTELMKKAGLH